MFDELSNEEISFLLTCIQFENDYNKFPTLEEIMKIMEVEEYDLSELQSKELNEPIKVTDDARMWLMEQGYLELNKKLLH